MTLWFIFAAMTAAAIFAVLWPLGRDPRSARGGSDLIVYKDQLHEIDRDRAAGLIGEAEAEAARLEVSRRLLAAAAARPRPPTAAEKAAAPRNLRRRVATLAVLVILPLGPPSLYVALGSPNLPGEPAFARVNAPHGHQSIAALVSEVETHLAHAPNDGRGWEMLAPVYMRLGRFDDAVEARRKALVLNGETATRHADLGEALAAAADGVVTAQAKAEFDRAVALDARQPKARYYLGLAAEQDGNSETAAAIWRSLLSDTPADMPWVGFVRGALARVTAAPAGEANPSADESANAAADASADDLAAAAPAAAVAQAGPTAKDIAAAAIMSDDRRLAMVRGMVARLAARLQQDGGDVEGWLRLVRAYIVLGDRDKAKGAAADAKRALADRPNEIKRIDDLVKGLGLQG